MQPEDVVVGLDRVVARGGNAQRPSDIEDSRSEERRVLRVVQLGGGEEDVEALTDGEAGAKGGEYETS